MLIPTGLATFFTKNPSWKFRKYHITIKTLLSVETNLPNQLGGVISASVSQSGSPRLKSRFWLYLDLSRVQNLGHACK